MRVLVTIMQQLLIIVALPVVAYFHLPAEGAPTAAATAKDLVKNVHIEIAVGEGVNRLHVYLSEEHLRVNLTKSLVYGGDTIDVVTIDRDSEGENRHSTDVANCYYDGNLVNEDNEIVGWTSVSMCYHRAIHGIMTIRNDMYQLQPAAAASNDQQLMYDLKLISRSSTGAEDFKSDTYQHRLKRHEHEVPEATIEVSIVADEEMSSYHTGTDIQAYILDIMNWVSHLFRHPTTESVIKIAVVEILEFKENKLQLSGKENAQTIRDSFCTWKKDNVKGDIAVLLTRRDVCESSDSCSIVGLTNIKSMCKKSKSCAVVKDTGISSAFTIAHEIGHSLGVYHDGDKNANCNSGNYIMASSFEGSSNPHIWSSCSKEQIHEFLSSDQNDCLGNKPSTTVKPPLEFVPLLGNNYTLDEQCSLLLGKSAVACGKTNCSTLWCSISDGGIVGDCTSTQYSPPAAGSPCSINADNSQAFCYNGECIDSKLAVNVVHGSWGQWGPWSECSVSCGDGVQHSNRVCNSPIPQFSGDYCTGTRKRYRTCRSENCPAGIQDYRSSRCQELMPKANAALGMSVTKEHWTSVDEEVIASLHLHPCKLYCQPEKSHSFSILEDSVPDGVSCLTHGSHDKGVCVDRKCIKVGCDNNLNTPTYTDLCGVECGDNSTCSLVKDSFVADQYNLLVNAFTIPSGSKEIFIQENSQSGSHMIFEDVHTHNVFDGSKGENHGLLAGTIFYYSQSDRIIHANGPVKHDIQVKVFVKNTKSVWEYSYISPLAASSDNDHDWIIGEWSDCSTYCDGNGVRTRSVKCAKSNGGKIVDDSNCQNKHKPDTTKHCDDDECKNHYWKVDIWSKCDTNCGSGTKTRQVTCRRIVSGETVDQKYCDPKVKPTERQSCKVSDCPKWEPGNWSQCSVTCGNGTQSRTVQCVTVTGLTSEECDAELKPNELKSCSLNECVTACEDEWVHCSAVKRFGYCTNKDLATRCCKSCSN